MIMKRFIASLLCALLVAPGCATSQRPRAQVASQAAVAPATPAGDREVLGEFARQLPLGARVRATVAGHHTIRGTLLKRTDVALVVQPRARVAEPLVEIPFSSLLALEQEQSSSGTGKAVAIGVAVGVGAALGFLMLIAAALGGD
jgi:hypothetical protein